MIERYGGVGYASSVTREKIINTNIERYGCEHSLQNTDVREKAKKTNLERYGTASPTQSEIVKEKTKRTMLERYGVEHALQSEQFLNKSKQTRKNHFDDKPHKKSKIVKEKIQKSKINRYNTNNSNNQNTSITRPNIKIFIKELLDQYNIEYKSNDRSILGSKELDIYIPSKKLAIECNGCYWHSESKKPDNSYHIVKMRECEKLGIQLIQIWEDWIVHKPEIIKSLILSKLGIYKDRIYARKCTIKEIGYKASSKFLENNHIQGSTSPGKSYGLFYKDKLIGTMVFGGRNGCWELKRFCTLLNTQVIGAAGKLLKYFIRAYHPTKIISFSSNDISNGNLYKSLGFEIEGPTTSSYWYVEMSTYKRFHRSFFQKSRLIKEGCDKNLSESQIMSNLPYYKIYDSGHMKWVLKNLM